MNEPRLPFEFDFKNPDYARVYAHRSRRLAWLRANPERLVEIKKFYRLNPIQFIIDWGCTADPRLARRKLPTVLPFLPYARQIEWLQWAIARYQNDEFGVTVKSRETGVTWLAVALAVTLSIFNDGLIIGFGSNKESSVDKLGDPKSIFYKIRQFTELLPPEFRGGWNRDKHAPFMRCIFPESGSVITGEAGVQIGRGGRYSIYYVDESAFLQQPQLVESALSEATPCRIDISTPFGRQNPFADKVHSGETSVFRFHWRDDPRKDQEWYDKRVKRLAPVVVAQELDLDFDASIEGILIPTAWVQAAVDAHIKLGIQPTGARLAALDIADEGPDMLSQAGRYGILLEQMETWSGSGSDIYKSVERSMRLCDLHGYPMVMYDADGLGAGARGDARMVNEKRDEEGERQIPFIAFRGSEGVLSPDGMTEGKRNKNMFKNRKAQMWYMLRLRFAATYKAVVEGEKFDPDAIVSISSSLPELTETLSELSQPTYTYNTVGKMIINKKPKGTKSPNRADAIMIAYAQRTQGFFSD